MVSGLTDAVLEKLMTEESCRGEALSRELGVTRAAVWKQIEKLRALGFGIESSPKDGYRLVFVPDSVRPPVLRRGLDTKWAGCEIAYFPQCDSTNRIARQMAQQGAPHGERVFENVAGRSGDRGDDRRVAPEQTVENRALADVRFSREDGGDPLADRAPRAVGGGKPGKVG